MFSLDNTYFVEELKSQEDHKKGLNRIIYFSRRVFYTYHSVWGFHRSYLHSHYLHRTSMNAGCKC